MEKELAERLANLAAKVTEELGESVGWVNDACSEDEALYYRRAIATILTELLTRVMNPIYRAHPELAPPGMTIPTGAPSCRIHGQVGFTNHDPKSNDDDPGG